MRRKCRKFGGIAVMELVDVGVQTRAKTATGKVHKKRRSLNVDEEAEYNKVTSSTTSTTSYIQLRSRRILVDHHRHDGNRCLRANSNHDDEVSCCSSNIGSSDNAIDIELPDLEDESFEVETSTHLSSSESMREMTPFSDLRAEPEDPNSASRSPGSISRRRSMVEKMPTDAELEKFFAPAEKRLQNQFAEKYNYDIVKDEPLEGRYEWVRLKP